jgi:hypothetical protein
MNVPWYMVFDFPCPNRLSSEIIRGALYPYLGGRVYGYFTDTQTY